LYDYLVPGKIDLAKEVERLAPCLDHTRGCAHVSLAIFSGCLTIALGSLLHGEFDWRSAPAKLFTFVGVYWTITTLAYAIFRRK
jgi:hypothetical protein